MNKLYYFLRIFYRAWFFILAAIPLIVLFPILIVLTFIPKGFTIIYWYARNIWSPFVLFGMGTPLRIHQKTPLEKGTPYMICPNHQSMLDIMVVLRISKNPVLFVGKKELKSIPLFGLIYKRVSVLVDRSKKESRAQVYTSVKSQLQNDYSVCVFPEGTVPSVDVLLDPFKPGAFKMAIEYGLDVVPVSIYNSKDRFPYEFTHGRLGPIKICVHSVLSVKGKEYHQHKDLELDCRAILEKDLIRDYKKFNKTN